MKMKTIDDFNIAGKRVLLRVDINSPIDPKTKKIVNENRIQKSLPTINKLLDGGAKLAIIAHQGDTLDYQNLIPLAEHAEKLAEYTGKKVTYIDDVCGPAALDAFAALDYGEAVILGNLRYLTEEISTFENDVKLTPETMQDTYLVRRLKGQFDLYVNEAFAAAHRNAPSMVAFQEFMPSCAGNLFVSELSNLDKISKSPDKPSVFVLGGAKISDAFGMMNQVLENGTADKIITSGITGEVFLLADGIDIGETKKKFLAERNLLVFVDEAKRYLAKFRDKIVYPVDLAYQQDSKRCEIDIKNLPQEHMYMDIGEQTIAIYGKIISEAKTIFVNGPAGVYEDDLFALGTKSLWQAIAVSDGYSVIGGGDTVSAAAKFIDLNDVNYVCTAGGAMVRYLSGKKLPLIKAMEKASRDQ